MLTRLISLLFAGALLAACATNPFTGRSQLLILPESQETLMGVEAFQQMSKEGPVTQDATLNAPLRRVGANIARVADEMRAELGKGPYEWEFKVFDEPDTLNAWCLPGGKIGFYTGIYPVLEDEAGMAIVMGHEVCHALLRHGGERVSQNILVQTGMVAGGALMRDAKHRDTAIAALGAGVSIGVLLPYSRSHESEADREGLMLAARAGYDPRAAIRVWENMAKQGGGRPPEFLSTHPDPLKRIRNMRQWMPEALAAYERSNQQPNNALPTIPRSAKSQSGKRSQR